MIFPLKDDSDEVPFYDRFYLGGPETLRGFDFRDIGPRSLRILLIPLIIDETAGGHTYGLFSAEYSFMSF